MYTSKNNIFVVFGAFSADFRDFHYDVIDDVIIFFRNFVNLFMIQLFEKFNGDRSKINQDIRG